MRGMIYYPRGLRKRLHAESNRHRQRGHVRLQASQLSTTTGSGTVAARTEEAFLRPPASDGGGRPARKRTGTNDVRAPIAFRDGGAEPVPRISRPREAHAAGGAQRCGRFSEVPPPAQVR